MPVHRDDVFARAIEQMAPSRPAAESPIASSPPLTLDHRELAAGQLIEPERLRAYLRAGVGVDIFAGGVWRTVVRVEPTYRASDASGVEREFVRIVSHGWYTAYRVDNRVFARRAPR